MTATYKTAAVQKVKKSHVSFFAELFGPGQFVGLGLRLKSEIRTRTRARTYEIVTFLLHLDPKLSVNEILMTF
jgi:hypothetical protein